MIKKECSKCKRKTIGLIPICYRCDKKEYFKEYYKRDRERFKEISKKRYLNNLEEERKKRREYRNNHIEQEKNRSLQWYYKNQESQLQKFKERHNRNKTEHNKESYQKKKERLKTDIQFRLKENLSSRARMAILNHKGIKNSSSIELLGASIDVVRKHIESLFTEEMCWENWGRTTAKINGFDRCFEIDHIVPCGAFDLRYIEHQKVCFYYKNLQPLWWIDNNKKSDVIPLGWDGK